MIYQQGEEFLKYYFHYRCVLVVTNYQVLFQYSL